MRTTLDIEAPVLKQLKQIRKKEGGSLGSIASRLLARALVERRPERPHAFRWIARPMRARLDLADKEAVYAILDRAGRVAE